MLMYYSVICAWCKKQMELNGTEDPKLHEKVSHGMCETCYKEQLEAMDL